jgi:cell division protein ZapA
MNEEVKAFDVTILGRQFRVSCLPEEEKDLLAAVDFVDKKMNEIRGNTKTAGSERVAVMAALNIAHELLKQRGGKGGMDANEMRRKITSMKNTITEALADIQDKLF